MGQTDKKVISKKLDVLRAILLSSSYETPKPVLIELLDIVKEINERVS